MENEIVNELISCPKIITTRPAKQMKVDSRSSYTMRNNFSCASEDGKRQFEVFMRSNTQYPWIFSIGLQYKAESGTLILCRYNGKHNHRNRIADHNSFEAFHIHRLQDPQLSDDTSDVLDAYPTERYITFNEALYAFLNDCNIQNWTNYFPNLEAEISQIRFEGV